ncbi:hypothetical protein [Estrella lausannensis]|uniref:Uncharacterized protein n=1 Tax=Estrella lausannensis TaxID=483423 RepID=A0A0H5DPL9_9BACT|nr:hypothetical protein [Estrella lausannensis]CRX38516.1 Conserved hypothetical protein [Estrella lausannensis]
MKSIKHLIHPYIFVLKEGAEIEQNRLDYTLVMLKITPAEHFPSPADTSAAPESLSVSSKTLPPPLKRRKKEPVAK